MSGSSASTTPRIFVSHSHEDDDYCREFVNELRRLCGERDAVWYDEHNLGSGELIREIQRQLHQRPMFIVIFTRAALKRSQWVADECSWAYQLYRAEPGRTILPVTGGPIKRGDFIPDWLYLEGFRRIEAPGMQPYPPAEAARRAYAALTGSQPAAAPPPPRQVLPRERFPERLERLGFAAALATDPATGREVAFIRPPLCAVAAGHFRMGSDPKQDSEAYADEQPQIPVDLPAYAIARFPVTVAEYACFVDAGHAEPRKGLLGTDWQTQLTRLDHPVTCVSWYDATAYAAWLARLTGQPWALPSEAQWEKAARWDPARRASRLYPWGDRFEAARCNTDESGIGTTTAVGTYGPETPARDGSSPYGAQEMAGNVLEWTRTIYDAQAYRKKTFREDSNSTDNRVLRGGSWNLIAGVARAACRNYVRPDDAGDTVGFRVALLSAAPNSF
jgi:formylglycine-generating enzyme required for sulfatase activity